MATPPLPPPTPPNYKPIYPLIEKKLTTEKNWSLTKCRNTFMKDGGYLWQERNFKKEGMDTHHFEAEREMWIHYFPNEPFPGLDPRQKPPATHTYDSVFGKIVQKLESEKREYLLTRAYNTLESFLEQTMADMPTEAEAHFEAEKCLWERHFRREPFPGRLVPIQQTAKNDIPIANRISGNASSQVEQARNIKTETSPESRENLEWKRVRSTPAPQASGQSADRMIKVKSEFFEHEYKD